MQRCSGVVSADSPPVAPDIGGALCGLWCEAVIADDAAGGGDPIQDRDIVAVIGDTAGANAHFGELPGGDTAINPAIARHGLDGTAAEEPDWAVRARADPCPCRPSVNSGSWARVTDSVIQARIGVALRAGKCRYLHDISVDGLFRLRVSDIS